MFDLTLFTKQYGTGLSHEIDMDHDEILEARLAINAMMAKHGYKAKDRAHILHVLGLAEDHEFRPEFKPEPPHRMCGKKIHNIGDPSTYRKQPRVGGLGYVHVCLECEKDKGGVNG